MAAMRSALFVLQAYELLFIKVEVLILVMCKAVLHMSSDILKHCKG
jgi:hypothetical protein